ncbi:MAG TPA: dihydrolipoyl dehydrogenase [Gemmatimonadota bacterium]|nr:dihydrolipoyl dehydrogenase [Gemmatimonadota bacterium]
MGDDRYDLVIVGSGPGGYVAAIRAGQLGLRTALVEKDPFQGGTCLHRGCIPTKALLENASRYQDLLHAEEFGLRVGDVGVDWERIQARKGRVVKELAGGVAGLLKKHRVEVIQGWGRLLDARRVGVDPRGAGDGEPGREPARILHARNVLLATGSVPREIRVAPFDGERILSSDHVLELETIPESLVVVGAGAVGVEFASIFARFGSRVTLVEALPRLLPIEDHEISAELERSFRKQGIDVRTGTTLMGVESISGGVDVMLGESGDSVIAERVLIAIGRAPVSRGIGLENVRAETRDGYVLVDEWCETAEPGLYAIGDLVPTPWLAHVASMEGVMVVERIAGLEVRAVPYAETPNCTYCEPEVASVGLTERRAEEEGREVRVGKFPFLASGRAKIAGHTEGFVKIVADARYDEVLGIHVIGYKATELIAEAGALLRLEATVSELIHTIHAHPTLSESVHEAAHAVHGAAIHF